MQSVWGVGWYLNPSGPDCFYLDDQLLPAVGHSSVGFISPRAHGEHTHVSREHLV